MVEAEQNQLVKDWWEQAQRQGTVLTKPIIRRKLAARVKELERQLLSKSAPTFREGALRRELDLILQEWKFDGEPLTTAREFLNQFKPWITEQNAFKKQVNQFLQNQGVENLKQLTKKLNKDEHLTTISKLEGNLVDIKAELSQSLKQVASLSELRLELGEKMTSVGHQVQGLLSSLEKGLITAENWKGSVTNFANVIKGIMSYEKRVK
jgi:hypothetical protein